MQSSASATTGMVYQMFIMFKETIDEVRPARSNRRSLAPGRQAGIMFMSRQGYMPVFAAAFALAIGQAAVAGDYRGMSAGWPVYANGYNAAGYAAQPAAGPAYYVARPAAVAPAASPARTGVMYMPVRAAYANPAYFAAYGRTPVAYQPVTTAGYAPTAAGHYAPAATTYYAPVTANYAPANSYAVTPAGLGSAGSEAAAYLGQPTPLNYVPPRFAYRPAYASVPVYMYRPVTTYNPITAQPVTCLQASTATTCQPTCQRQRSWFSWLHPANWFGGSRCGAAPAPVTSYCGTAASQCGQPYYPIQPVTPVVPIVPAPATTIPTLPPNIIPSAPRGIVVPPAGTTIPPPPTAPPGTRGVITTPGLSPADLQPRLPAGTTITPAPGGTFTPGTTITPLPSNTVPPGTFGAPPSTTVPPPGSFQTTPVQPPPGFGSGSFGSGANYPPPADPYSPALTPANGPASPVQAPNEKNGPPHNVFGSGYRPAPSRSGDDQVIRAPELRPAMPPSVQTVPDLDAASPPRPSNSAPQLLNPRDKTARVHSRWAVVPAVWPQRGADAVRVGSAQHVSAGTRDVKDMRPMNLPAQANAAEYDDRGWRSAF